jgi:hypothetical protein
MLKYTKSNLSWICKTLNFKVKATKPCQNLIAGLRENIKKLNN